MKIYEWTGERYEEVSPDYKEHLLRDIDEDEALRRFDGPYLLAVENE